VTGRDDSALTRDDFLGGRVTLYQPRHGYRAGIDPVLLAAAAPVQAGESVLELGCGAGAAFLCLLSRVPEARVMAVERQADMAALAARNARENQRAAQVHHADLAALPAELRAQSFDHVILNPPYFPGASSASPDPGRSAGRTEETPLSTWIDTAARRLAPRGRLTAIIAAPRLPDMLAALAGRLGSTEVLPLAPREGRAPRLLLVRARKGGRAAFALHAPLVLHAGAEHGGDGEDYTSVTRAILRDGQALPWPD